MFAELLGGAAEVCAKVLWCAPVGNSALRGVVDFGVDEVVPVFGVDGAGGGEFL